MRVGRDRRRIKAGDTVYIPPGSVQQVRNTGRRTLVFLCLVDPAWTPECERILQEH
jgi:mannose-6-phosphate isomerase-like protein (cupin superfamily)